MKIKVNEQTQRFYLAFDKWESVVGHEIKIGKYRFCAIPLSKGINISEVTSGSHFINVPMSVGLMLVTSTKEDTMQFYEKIGERLKQKIESIKDFDNRLKKNAKNSI